MSEGSGAGAGTDGAVAEALAEAAEEGGGLAGHLADAAAHAEDLAVLGEEVDAEVEDADGVVEDEVAVVLLAHVEEGERVVVRVRVDELSEPGDGALAGEGGGLRLEGGLELGVGEAGVVREGHADERAREALLGGGECGPGGPGERTLRRKKVQKFQPGICRWFSERFTSSERWTTAASKAATMPSFILATRSAHAGGEMAPWDQTSCTHLRALCERGTDGGGGRTCPSCPR